MTRYVTPDAGKFTRQSYDLVKSGDGIWFAMVPLIVGSFSIPIIIIVALNVNLLFFLFLLVFLYPVAAWTAYGAGTVKLGVGNYGEDQMYVNSLREYRKTIGDHTHELARPVMEKVYEHAKTMHQGGDCQYEYTREYSDCKICKPRLAILTQLAPVGKSVDSKDDIEQAKLFLQARKEITGA